MFGFVRGNIKKTLRTTGVDCLQQTAILTTVSEAIKMRPMQSKSLAKSKIFSNIQGNGQW